MKQGHVTNSNAGKVEPVPHATNPTAVAQLGIRQGNHATECGTTPYRSEKLYEGRGLKAPMAGTDVHHSGSQGKHR